MKRAYIGLICCFAMVAAALTVYATPAKRFDAGTGTCRVLDSGSLDWETRAWGKGGKAFKQVCKSCHTRGNTQGATFLWEESKTSQGWNNIFARQRAQCARNGVWARLSADELLLINDYLYRWSANSMDVNDSA